MSHPSIPGNVPPPPPGATSVVYYVYTMGHLPHGPKNINQAYGCCSPLNVLRPILVLANWALWIIYLAGASQLMSQCNQGNFNGLGFGPITSTYGTLNGVGDCSHYYGLLWWSVWLQFICIALSTLLAWQCILPKIDAVDTLTIYFFIASSITMFVIADEYNNAIYISSNKQMGSFSLTSGASLVCAGSIGNLILNFIYIIWNSWIHVPSPPTFAPVQVPADVLPQLRSFPIDEDPVD